MHIPDSNVFRNEEDADDADADDAETNECLQ